MIFLIKYICDPHLLQGEYRTVFEKMYLCQSTNSFQVNLYFSKKTSNITEVKGNFTFLEPFTDNLTVSKYLIIIVTNTHRATIE
jgi:hypothetical protein